VLSEPENAEAISPEDAQHAQHSQHNHDHDFACGLAAVMLSGSGWGVIWSVICILTIAVARLRQPAVGRQRFYPGHKPSNLHLDNRAILQVWLI
jgi:hypothetical protein